MVAGLDCPQEVAILRRVLEPLPGVEAMEVNLVEGSVSVEHRPEVTRDHLIRVIGETGMRATPPGGDENPEAATARRVRWALVTLSGVLTGLGLALQWSGTGEAAVLRLLFAGAIVSGGWFIFPKAWQALRVFSPDMNLLMTLAVAGAMGIGQWSEGAAVAFLFGLSESLEAFSLQRARRAIASLLELAPATAWVLGEGTAPHEVPVEAVAPGQRVIVRPGGRVPLDGVVEEGSSHVNQASITGESLPVLREPGDGVYAGTINGEGTLHLRVSRPSGETLLARIIRLVGEAQARKAPSEQFVDRFARVYTPAVLGVALLVFLLPPLVAGGAWGVWFYRALVLLVIACPCALVIATPVSIVSGLTAMARRGVLIKGGATLEMLGRVRALALDKTGTLTEGRPRVQEVIPVAGTDPRELLRIGASLAAMSDHPLSQAIVAHAAEAGVEAAPAEGHRASRGRGVEAALDGHPYFAGNHRYAHELGVCTPELELKLEAIEAQARSVVIVGHQPHDGCAGEVLGIFAVSDSLRENVPPAIAALHRAGVAPVVILSGDNQQTVDAIARQAGIDQAYGDLLPDEKIGRVERLMETGVTGMVGDGINDAPALATAHVGIAMGTGTDAALENADVTLVRNDLTRVAGAIALGRRAAGIIRFNIVFALAVKALFLALVLAGYPSLWMAIAADTGATLLVIANALRLLRVE